MFDLSVVAFDGRWILLDEAEGELGDFATRDEALKAAGAFAVLDREPRHVLIQDDLGEWDETVVQPPRCISREIAGPASLPTLSGVK